MMQGGTLFGRSRAARVLDYPHFALCCIQTVSTAGDKGDIGSFLRE